MQRVLFIRYSKRIDCTQKDSIFTAKPVFSACMIVFFAHHIDAQQTAVEQFLVQNLSRLSEP
jgi:hypothetical protein